MPNSAPGRVAADEMVRKPSRLFCRAVSVYTELMVWLADGSLHVHSQLNELDTLRMAESHARILIGGKKVRCLVDIHELQGFRCTCDPNEMVSFSDALITGKRQKMYRIIVYQETE